MYRLRSPVRIGDTIVTRVVSTFFASFSLSFSSASFLIDLIFSPYTTRISQDTLLLKWLTLKKRFYVRFCLEDPPTAELCVRQRLTHSMRKIPTCLIPERNFKSFLKPAVIVLRESYTYSLSIESRFSRDLAA